MSHRVFRYGPSADHEADLRLPAVSRPPVVCLLHGGFWRMPHGRDQFDEVADDLTSRGLATWNLGYRRVGAAGSAWPATLDDVAAGVDHLAQLGADGVALDLDRVAVVGHSAGGQLALWVGARRHGRVRARAAVGLAPIVDLAAAHRARLGGKAVAEWIGGPPSRHPERVREASPIDRLPLGVRQLLLHGTADAAVPIKHSRRYAAAATAAGDDVELVELAGSGHMAFLDPGGDAHATLVRWLLAGLTGPARRDPTTLR